jgi:acyl carrier protein
MEKETIKNKLIDILEDKFGMDRDFQDDRIHEWLDSLDIIELSMSIEMSFNIRVNDNRMFDLEYLDQIVDYVITLIRQQK